MTDLVCLIKGHLLCHCTCSELERCCGCLQSKTPGYGDYYHCLDCGRIFPEGSSEEDKVRRGSRTSKELAEARTKSIAQQNASR